MAEYQVIFPFENNKIHLLKANPTFIGNKHFLRVISPEQIGRILKKHRSAEKDINPKSKCCVYVTDATELPDSEIDRVATAIAFSLNANAKERGIGIRSAYKFSRRRVWSYNSFCRVHSTSTERPDAPFSLRPGTKPEALGVAIDSAISGMAAARVMETTLKRFNAACSRARLEERVIDLAISIESLFNGDSEISFQFALFNSLISSSDPGERPERFQALKKLYNWRSKLVHGSTPFEDLRVMDEEFGDLIGIASLSILYKLQFLKLRPHAQWQEHLRCLALGAEARIWDGGQLRLEGED